MPNRAFKLAVKTRSDIFASTEACSVEKAVFFAPTLVDGMSIAVNLAKISLISGDCCAVLALDITAPINWNLIKKALTNIGVPAYLANLVEYYISERTFRYGRDEGSQEYIGTASVS